MRCLLWQRAAPILATCCTLHFVFCEPLYLLLDRVSRTVVQSWATERCMTEFQCS